MIGRRLQFGPEYFGPKVLVTVPNTGNIHNNVAAALIEMVCYENHIQRCHGHVCFPVDRPYEQNQHQIVATLLKDEYDWWVSIDADNPPTRNPIDLIFLDKDMIGCPTPVWQYQHDKAERPIMWNAYDYVPEEDGYREHDPKEGLQEVDAVGTGCFVISERCFNNDSLRKGAFTRFLDRNGLVYKGNDISFCERLKQTGFHIFAHYGYPCRHYNNIDLLDAASAYGQLVKKISG